MMPEPILDSPSISIDDYLARFTPDDLVITASNRLAREVRGRFAERGGLTARLLPEIVPYNAWIRSCWQQLRFQAMIDGDEQIAGATLLTEFQEALLWEMVLRRAGAGERLLFLDETIDACKKSASIGEQYQVPWDDAAWQRDEECLIFRSWYEAVREECKRRRWVLPGRLPAYLSRKLRQLEDALRKRVFLIGFEEPTPAQLALFRTLETVAESLQVLGTASASTPSAVSLRSAVDADEELRAAAQWAAARLVENPNERIAVVLPDLGSRLSEAEEVFLRILHPEMERRPVHGRDRSFDLTLGRCLADDAVARAGLLLLSVSDGDVSMGAARSLLRCAYFAREPEEREARARLENSLLNQRVDSFPLSVLREAAHAVEQESGESLGAWKAAMQRVEQTDWSGTLSPSVWSSRIRSLWLSCLWLGPPVLSSEEFQSRHRVLEELGAMAELDDIQLSMQFGDFVRLLRARFEAVAFQPESKPKPILVAGIFEVTGLRFDAAWVCGLNDHVLPRTATPDPFLPRSLQRDFNLPGSSAAREISFGRRTFDRLVNLAPELVMSFPRRREQEELEPSPFLRSLAVDRNLPIVPVSPGQSWPALAEPDLELFADWHAGALSETQGHVPRGAQVLADQSDCPFRAFARTRLASEAHEAEAALMNRMDQGSFIHLAMERFWKETQTQRALLEMNRDAIRRRIEDCVEEALRKFDVSSGNPLAIAQKEAERIRVAELMTRWMELEAERRPFGVLDVERNRSVTLGAVELKIRPDRVDILGDKTLALIDYKTGSVAQKMWDGDRPQQPQLLLYLTAERRPVSAIAFASLKVTDPGWKAYARNLQEQFCPAKKDPTPGDGWEAFVDRSKRSVERLMEQFAEGFAAVDPAPDREPCTYCEQRPFCRIAEVRQAEGENIERGDE